MTMKWGKALVVAGSVAILGCAVGPDYKRPDVPVPGEYRGSTEEGGNSDSFGDETWWDAFQDPVLRDLLQRALRENHDVRIAVARVLEAGAVLGITRADQLPSVAVNGGAAYERVPAQPGRAAGETGAFQLGGSIAWELDFWGKFRRATESARARLLAQEWARRAVITSLVSDVAAAYFELRELDLELEISRQSLASRKESLRLTQTLADRGATSLLDVRQAEQLVFATEASIPDVQRRIEQQENLISFLLGGNPQAIARGRKLTEQPHPPEVPAGLPSALLERRPDIREAEQQLIAANAQIGVAKADLFPRISLTGSGGFQSADLGELFNAPGRFWSIGGGLLQPVFEGGRIRSQIKLNEARAEEATLLYQRTVQSAFRDVADSLVGYSRNREFREQQEHVTDSAREAQNLSDMRYRGGGVSYLEVLDSETRYFSSQLSLAQAQLRELTSLVQIYRSLGGGWNG